MPTSLPLFHLIIYMMESGMPVEKIEEDLRSLNNFIFQISNGYSIQYKVIKLLYPVYITNSPNIEYIKAYNATYNFYLERREDGCGIVVKPVTVLEEDLEGIIGREEIGVTIIPFLKTLSISANLSALRLD